MFRQVFLFLSRRRGLRRWMETSASAQLLTRRFVAGRTLDDVLGVCRRLEGEKLLATLDHLGENVTSEAEAHESTECMLRALASLRRERLTATVSIKLTQFGLDLSTALCQANVERLTSAAQAMASRVEVDMESSEYVDRTLAIVEALHERDGCVRSVLQAYLYRTADDLRRMNRAGIRVRLCKGAYNEPHTVAFRHKSEVDANYLKLARILLDEGTDPAMATHDPAMVDGILDHAAQHGYGPERFEFQMLYGVRRDLQRQLAACGWRVRLYVPYGDAWYPYFMRRLAERPANVLFVARNLLRA
jgi:proline dehydrogenase